MFKICFKTRSKLKASDIGIDFFKIIDICSTLECCTQEYSLTNSQYKLKMSHLKFQTKLLEIKVAENMKLIQKRKQMKQ